MATKPKTTTEAKGNDSTGLTDQVETDAVHVHNFKAIKDKDGTPAPGLINVRCSCGTEGHR